MKGRGSHQPPGLFGNVEDYALVFIRRVHRLLALGYARLKPSDYRRAGEEDITGCLVHAIEDLQDDPESPKWIRGYSVQEEARIHDPERRGKRRRRLDIRIDCTRSLPRSRFPIEAKRLAPGHSVGKYLGGDGLGCFLDARYARNETIAGMLGYVQSKTPDEWAQKIGRAIAENAARLRVLPDGRWRKERLVDGLEHTYLSGHHRPEGRPPIEIYHTLLSFN